jgi:TusA-related sulfurtransferase
MKKTILFSIIALALGAGSAFAHCGNCPGDKKAEPAKAEMKAEKKKDCGDCPMHKKQAAGKHGEKMCGGVTCPENIKGAKTATVNIKNGVETTVTAKDAETAAQIQELALVHYAPKAEKCPGCPTTVPGAKTSVTNIENGIKVTITAEDAKTAAKIQAAAASEHKGHAAPAKEKGKKEAKAAKKYMCAMKCVESEKPGKCPKCGMPMEAVK